MRSSTWWWSSLKTPCSTHPSHKYDIASIVELRQSTGNPHDGTSGCHRERGQCWYPVNHCGTSRAIVLKSIINISDVQLNFGSENTIGKLLATGRSPAAILLKTYPEVIQEAEIQSVNARTGHRYASSSGSMCSTKGLMSATIKGKG